MPVPKRKVSKARRDSRSANKGIKPKTFGACPNCTAVIMPHQACLTCGFYKGKKVLTTKSERVLKRNELRAQAAARSPEAATGAVPSEPSANE